MAIQEEIDKAIGAHGMWKARLKQAIETGQLEVSVDTIKVDNQCAFGKWLYGPTLTDADRNSPHFKDVKSLHAEFHKVAGRVAELAVVGKKTDAEKIMAMGGEFAGISAKLTSAMMKWKSGG